MAAWEQQAAAQKSQGGGGGLGSLLGGLAGGGGALAGMLGASPETAGLLKVFEALGLDSTKAAMVAPVVLDFLKARVKPELLSMILGAVPMLGGGATAGAGGVAGVASALGGLFGKN